MDGNVKKKETKASKADEELLQEAKERYAIGLEAWKENRKNYLESLKASVSNDLWDDATKRRRGLNRPALTMNKLNAITKQVIGDYRKNEVSIKVRPVDSKADVEKAKMRDGLIRNIQDVSHAQDAYITGLECAVRGGYGFIKVDTDYAEQDGFDLDIRIPRITNPLSIVPDPFYLDVTGANMGWCFETEILPKKKFEKDYPKAKPQSWKELESLEHGEDWYPEGSVRIANYWRVETEKGTIALLDDGERVDVTDDEDRQKVEESGRQIVREKEYDRKKVRCYKLCGHQKIDEYDFPSKFIPIIVVAGEEVDVEGKRLFRSSIYYSLDAQRMSDYWKTAATETVALQPKAPWKGTVKEIEGNEKYWFNANTGNWQFLPFTPDPQNPGGPTRVQPPAFSAGEINMALAASDDIKATSGVYDASLGARSNETSGKAILARQREGDNATFIFIDNIARAIQQVGTVVNDMIPRVYDSEREVRVLGIDGETEIVRVNQPVLDPVTLEYVTLNDLSEGKYDITIDTGPSFATQRAEAAESMMEFIRVLPAAGAVTADLVAKNMDWPGADEFAERLKKAMPPQVTADPDSPEGQQQAQQHAQQQAQAQQMQQQMLQAHMQTEQGKQQAENAKSHASVVKSQAEVVKAHADVIQAVHGTPEPQTPAAQPPAPMAPAQAPVAPPMAPAPPTAAPSPQVVISLNADHAMGQVADHVQGMAAEHAGNSANMVQFMQMIAATLQANQQLNSEQGQLLQALVAQSGQMQGEMAGAIRALAGAAEMQNKIALAPVVPKRDPKTRQIVSAQKML